MGRRLRRDLVARFGGDEAAAEDAIAEFTAEPDCLVGWATRMIRREDPEAPVFSWDEVPASMRESAVRGMAMAYLLETWGGVTREHAASDQRAGRGL